MFKANLLIDLMAKNKLQTKCDTEMVQLFEQMSLDNREAIDQNFSKDVLSRDNLSLGAQRQLETLLKVF